ncbi:MAG: DUF1800 domain-containing protein [Deltaproteobacteria bacterium]|nr:DUF1800 domain-containing protein [Deltaproteobacteria bacterium]
MRLISLSIFLITCCLFAEVFYPTRSFSLFRVQFIARCTIKPLIFHAKLQLNVRKGKYKPDKKILARAKKIGEEFCRNRLNYFVEQGRDAISSFLSVDTSLVSGQSFRRCVGLQSINSAGAFVFRSLINHTLAKTISCSASRYPINISILVENGEICLNLSATVPPGTYQFNCSFEFGSGTTRFFTRTYSYQFVNNSQAHPWGLDGNPVSLARYAGDFNRVKAAHLLRKVGLGATKRELDMAEQMGLDAFVNKLVEDCNWSNSDSALRLLHPRAEQIRQLAQLPAVHFSGNNTFWETPESAPGSGERFKAHLRDTVDSLNNYLYFQFLNGSPLCASMWVILHNWFALKHDALDRNRYAGLTGDYVELIMQHLVGSFEDLVKKMHSNAHMLVWLDNRYNRRGFGNSNENYSREALELFTIKTNDLFAGNWETYIANYNENDVKHLTRAAVGYQEYFADYVNNTNPVAPYGKPYKFIPNAKPFCTGRQVVVVWGQAENQRGTVFGFPEHLFYSTTCTSVTSTREHRFGFNKSRWDRIGNAEEEMFRNGVVLFQGTDWEIRDQMFSHPLNINSFEKIFISESTNPSNPTFFGPSNGGNNGFIADNITHELLYRHRRIPGAGSSASRALAIQLLGYFIGPKAAKSPLLVADLAELIIQEEYRLGPVLKTLLKSEALFSYEHVDTIVKTPFEYALMLGRVLKIPQMYYHRFAQNWIVTLGHVNTISAVTGYPNLDMPSVFGVPVAGVQRNLSISDGRSFINPINTVMRRRLISQLQRNIFYLFTRGAFFGDQGRAPIEVLDAATNSMLFTVPFNQNDQFGDDGSVWSDVWYLAFGEQYPYHPQEFPWSKYSGNIFSHFDNLRNEFENIDDIDEVFEETLLRLGVPLNDRQKEIAKNFLTRLHPQESRPCWNNFVTTTVFVNGIPVTISADEAKRRFFDLKYLGLVYALLMTPEAWLK